MARITQHPTDLIENIDDFAAPRGAWRAQYRSFAQAHASLQHASPQPGDDARWIVRADANAARTSGSH